MSIKSFLLDDSLRAHEKVMADRAANRSTEIPYGHKLEIPKIPIGDVIKEEAVDLVYPFAMITISTAFGLVLESVFGTIDARILGKQLARQEYSYIQELNRLEEKRQKKQEKRQRKQEKKK